MIGNIIFSLFNKGLNTLDVAQVANYCQVSQAYEGNTAYNNNQTNGPRNCLMSSDIYAEHGSEKL